MKWTFIIKQKIKLALLLASIMLLISLTNMMERRNIDGMNKSFASIYYDRLIPATDIFYLTENVYNKRMLLERFLYSEETGLLQETRSKLATHNHTIANLIEKFSKTYLVETESAALKSVRMGLDQYALLEDKIINLSLKDSKARARIVYETEGREMLRKNTDLLKELTTIQSKVGLELIHNSQGLVSSSHILMSLQIALTIVIGLLAQGLIIASRQFDTKTTNFNLN